MKIGLTDNKKFVAIAKQYDLEFKKEERTLLQSYKTQRDFDITEHVFNLPRPGVKPIYTSVILLSGDIAIIDFKRITEGDLNKVSANEHLDFAKKTEASLGVLDYQFYIAGLRNTAKIKYFDKSLAKDSLDNQ